MKKTYTTSRSERYHGNLTSYRFAIKHRNQEFSFEDIDKLRKFFSKTNTLLFKKVEASPIPKKWKKIMRLTASVKGEGKIDSQKGSHDFPLWRATTDSIQGAIKSKDDFRIQFKDTRLDLLRQIEELFTENLNAYYEESSSQATSITIEESLLYVETTPIKKHAAKTARKKKRGRKNSGIRHRNPRMGKGGKNSALRRK